MVANADKLLPALSITTEYAMMSESPYVDLEELNGRLYQRALVPSNTIRRGLITVRVSNERLHQIAPHISMLTLTCHLVIQISQFANWMLVSSSSPVGVLDEGTG